MGLNHSIHSDPIADYMATDRLFHELRGRREMAEVIAEEKGMFLSDMHRSSFKHKEAQLKREKKLTMELKLARARIEELQDLLSSKKKRIPSQKHISMLIEMPSAAPKFDKVYGDGAADAIFTRYSVTRNDNQDPPPPSYQDASAPPPAYIDVNK